MLIFIRKRPRNQEGTCRSYQRQELLLQAALVLLQGLELLLLALRVHAQLADLSDTRDTRTPERVRCYVRPRRRRQTDRDGGMKNVRRRRVRYPGASGQTFFSWAWAWAFRLLICCWDRDAASSFCWEARSRSCRSATSRSSSMIRERSDTVATWDTEGRGTGATFDRSSSQNGKEG